jgi:hypothetical protein
MVIVHPSVIDRGMIDGLVRVARRREGIMTIPLGSTGCDCNFRNCAAQFTPIASHIGRGAAIVVAGVSARNAKSRAPWNSTVVSPAQQVEQP